MGDVDMKISEIAILSGLSSSTIRYYEKLKIIRNVSKGADGNRCFTDADLKWIQFLSGFKDARIPLKEMIHYADLYYCGDTTIDQRLVLLHNHHKELLDEQIQIQKAIEFIERKVSFYENKKKNIKDHSVLNCL